MASIPASERRPAAPKMRLSLSDPIFRSVVYQVVVVGAVGSLVWYLVSNLEANMETRKIASGFGFLTREAGFAILQKLIDYAPTDTYLRALIVGVLNTVLVAVIGIVLATILGTLLGIGRLSRNWLVARLCTGYVETLRNIPLAVQLFFWYVVIKDNLPAVRQALHPLPGFFLSQRGLAMAVPADNPANPWILAAFAVGVAATVALSRWARRRQAATGQPFPTLWVGAALMVALPILTWLAAGAPTAFDVPELRGFNFRGGIVLIPEFVTLLVGLTTYTAAFIAEIVRSGILAVSHGQTEAALALGLPRGLTLRLVVLPQALRVIVPPMISQYLNLTKNSSLALLVGYPDIVSVANTTLNQTGQAIEGIAIIMAVFLAISLSISGIMNWYNKKIALVER
ncbi:MAG TPA: amino acid ABC transporter permease [Alphaproteobacteria bacterium]|nr:amino acid ABC transporter permease [Alphaproteobacteria bacterium]